MKRLLAYLLLVLSFGFIFNTKADDISDFEIEGMSVGDSALEFLDKLDTLYSTYDSQSHRHLHTLGLIATIHNKVQNEIKNKKYNKQKTKEKQKSATKNNLNKQPELTK